MMTDLLTQLQQARQADDIILAGIEHRFSLNDLDALCNELEQHLREAGVTMLALHADNGPAWVVADLVCQRMKLCLVPLPTFFSPLQLKAALVQCGCKYMLTDNPQALQVLVESTNGRLARTGLQLCRINTDSEVMPAMPDGTQKITFTSGSTGKPRGVCLGNDQLLLQARALAQAVGLDAPRHLCLLPLSTLLENIAGVYAPLLAGGQVILPTLAELGYQGSRLAMPQQLLAVISKVAPQTLILIPELLKLLVTASKAGWQAPDTLRFIAVGGSKVGKALLQEAWALGLPVYEGYGLSECASVVSLNTPQDCLPGSCGKALTHLDVRVSDGEIVIGGNPMLGYLDQPSSWYPRIIHSGDLGTIDARGFMYLSGRKDNVLVSSYGRNISPEWPESELLANPALRDAVVFGDAMPYCVALVSCRDPQPGNDLIQAWIDKVNGELPDYARIRAWHRLQRPLASQPGLLTSNGRPRRVAIANKFASTINALYTGSPAAVCPSPAKELT